MSLIRISLFGQFQFQRGDQSLTGFDARRVQELFCYLLLYRDRPHPRETLAGLLWPNSTTAQSMKYLRQALWQLQTVLDAGAAGENGHIIRAESEWVRLDPQAELWLDVAEFERACALVQDTAGQELDEKRAQTVGKALELYQGDLLEGWYQDWCLFERERLQLNYLTLLEKRMAYCEAHGDYEAGLECGIQVLRYDVAHEGIHRRLMRLHYLSGDRTAALRQYERCVAFLHQELGVPPAKRTVALYQQIRSDRPLDANVGWSQNGRLRSEQAQPKLPQALHRLKQLETAFNQVQQALQQVIQEVETDLERRD